MDKQMAVVPQFYCVTRCGYSDILWHRVVNARTLCWSNGGGGVVLGGRHAGPHAFPRTKIAQYSENTYFVAISVYV